MIRCFQSIDSLLYLDCDEAKRASYKSTAYIAPEQAINASEGQRIPEIELYPHQGHDYVTSLMHHQSLSFTDYELRDIKESLTEWGILQRN